MPKLVLILAEPVTAARLYNLSTDKPEFWGGGNEGGRKQNAAKSGKKKRKNTS